MGWDGRDGGFGLGRWVGVLAGVGTGVSDMVVFLGGRARGVRVYLVRDIRGVRGVGSDDLYVLYYGTVGREYEVFWWVTGMSKHRPSRVFGAV